MLWNDCLDFGGQADARHERIGGHAPHSGDDLRNALVTLNVNTVADVVRRVSYRDPKVGAVLAERAERFAYTSILDALEGIQAD